MYDPNNRRYLYPFINCTNCGPRYSIIESLPYDRPNISMKIFDMCRKCREEYEDPGSRRFHAQPIACDECGPQVALTDKFKKKLAVKGEAIQNLVNLIKSGNIIALKGLGGFQLICDASNENTVNLLRERKNREEKPFAVMFSDFNTVQKYCFVNKLEKRLLESPESPIVLLRKKCNHNDIAADSVAPDNPYLGIMLPYTPLHHLLASSLNMPIVATSGNISEEPICIDNDEAYEQLSSIADYFLVHNRPIIRQVDDSVVRIINDRELVLRRARGYAPLPIRIERKSGDINYIAVGAHLKNNIALNIDENIFVGQHIGDLSSERTFDAFLKNVNDLSRLYDLNNPKFICDMHPGYISTNYVKSIADDPENIQHHFAHIASCKAENQLTDKSLGVSWDGTGFGHDGKIWGGELFLSDESEYYHVGQFRYFPLIGGDKAIKEARRSAVGLLFQIYGHEIFSNSQFINLFGFSEEDFSSIERMLLKKINIHLTSSVGRLFDAVSSILGISQISNFEGQSAMKLEFIADPTEHGSYEFDFDEQEKIIIEWENIIHSIIEDKNNGIDIGKISSRFHNTLSMIVLRMSELFGQEKVVLSGGCFQNKFLTERIIDLLENNNFKVYTHQRIPPNDGGISLGQIAGRGVKYKNFIYQEMQKNNSTVY